MHENTRAVSDLMMKYAHSLVIRYPISVVDPWARHEHCRPWDFKFTAGGFHELI